MNRTRYFAIALLVTSGQALAEQQTMSPGQAFLMQFDTNKDKKVSQEEFLKPSQEQFKALDKNSDGTATVEEAEAFAKEMHQRMMQQMQQRQN